MTIDFLAAHDEYASTYPANGVHVRIVNVGQQWLVLLDASGAGLDVEKASDGRFSGDPQTIFG